jgi:osmotically inducible protein OsmC
MIMIRTGSAVWRGDLKGGKGTVNSQSGTLKETNYSFTGRFEEGSGTNPEELIAAAHAGCFSMALSAFLGKAGHTPKEISTKASLSLEQVEGNWTITKIHLDTAAQVPGINDADFQRIANDAKQNCPVSRVLKADISLSAGLRAG